MSHYILKLFFSFYPESQHLKTLFHNNVALGLSTVLVLHAVICLNGSVIQTSEGICEECVAFVFDCTFLAIGSDTPVELLKMSSE